MTDSDQAQVDSDPRRRSFKNLARVDIQVYIDVPSDTLKLMSGPGQVVNAIDVARDIIAESSDVPSLLEKLEHWCVGGAVVRASGR